MSKVKKSKGAPITMANVLNQIQMSKDILSYEDIEKILQVIYSVKKDIVDKSRKDRVNKIWSKITSADKLAMIQIRDTIKIKKAFVYKSVKVLNQAIREERKLKRKYKIGWDDSRKIQIRLSNWKRTHLKAETNVKTT